MSNKDNDGLEIKLVDNKAAGSGLAKNQPEELEELVLDDQPSDDELDAYSASVTKRTEDLKRAHEEKQATARWAQNAIQQNAALAQELETHRQVVANGEAVLLEQARGRIDAELAGAKRAYVEAYDTGDSDVLADLHIEVARLGAEKTKIDSYRPVQYVPQQYNPPPAPDLGPDPKAQDWHKANPWFQKDIEMTGLAMGVHVDLVKKGIDPSSEEYYQRIDEEIKKSFPDKVKKSRGNKVNLTKGQRAMAERLKIPLEDYAVQAVKDQYTDRGYGHMKPLMPEKAMKIQRAGQKSTVKLTQSQVDMAKRLKISPAQYAEQLAKKG